MEPRKPGPKNSITRRACPNCRQRKVRCSRTAPCSNCITAGLACPLETSSQRPSQNENSLSVEDRESLSDRIRALESTVQSILEHQSCAGERIEHPSPEPASSGQPGNRLANRPSLMEGEASFRTQALQASEVTELNSLAAFQSPAFFQELANLRGVLQDQGEKITSQRNTKPDRLDFAQTLDIELPPSAFVMQLLKFLGGKKDTHLVLFTFWGIQDRIGFQELCKSTYFTIEPLTVAQKTLFNGMISLILREIGDKDGLEFDSKVISHMRHLCERRFWFGVETYQVTAIATHENIMILVLAIIHASTMATLSLQWSLTTAAAGHCLTLGYHREKRLLQLPSPEAERARRLFWHVYISDKHLSQRLGRASTIQDWDVDAKPCAISSDPGQEPWDLAFKSFIDLARIQGQIYEKIYSPAAKARDAKNRVVDINALESELCRWHSEWNRIDRSSAHGKDLYDITFAPADVVYYSILTLIHRGTTLSDSARDVSSACYEAAHRGLQAHLTYYPQLNASGFDALCSYAIWVLYYTSFTPFVVTFLHCVANLNFDDLKLLQDVLLTLENIGSNLEYTEKQFKLCKSLCRIAEAFLNNQTSREDNVPVSSSASCLPIQSPLPNNWAWLDSQIMDLDGGGDISFTEVDGILFGRDVSGFS